MARTGSVIVVTHNSADCIQACLAAIADARGWGILVIDNASADSTTTVARRVAPQVSMISNQQNIGFAAAVNQGVRATQDEILVVMNPDVVANGNALDLLAETLRSERVAAASGALMSSEGRVTKGFNLRRFPTLPSALCEVLLLNKAWPHNPINRRYRCLDLDYMKPQEVEQPAGACLAFRRTAWAQVEGWDDGFFPVWFEDVDFCRRLTQAGWHIQYCPEAGFTHLGGQSVGKLRFGDRQAFWYRNLLRYFHKHHPKWQVAVLRFGMATGLAFRCLLSLFVRSRPGMPLREVLSGYIRAAWYYAVLGRS
ncbi:MAG TPA: glycosyltransferase family 2 protein [Terriglobales bacterium]